MQLIKSLLVALSVLISFQTMAQVADNGNGKPSPSLPDMSNRAQMLEDFGLSNESLPVTSTATDVQQLIYHGAPIQITLSVDTERRIVFDSAFEVGIDPQDAEAFSPEIYDRNLLLTVHQPIRSRLQIQMQNGQIIPVDIFAVNARVSNQPIEIVRQEVVDALNARKQNINQVPLNALHENRQNTSPGYVDMMRFAAQSMYAPERLIKSVKGATVIPVEKKPVRLMRFDLVSTEPVSSWQISGFFVTAVLIKNKHKAPVNLDPRLLLGNWRAATFHHRRIQEAGSKFDQTALYLVSDQPFEEALGVYKLIPQGQHGG